MNVYLALAFVTIGGLIVREARRFKEMRKK